MLGLQAQNSNAVISEVKAYDLEDGTALVEVRLSGNLADDVISGTLSVSGDGVSGTVSTRLSIGRPVPQPGNASQVVVASFPYHPTGGNGPDFVSVDITVSARRAPHGNHTGFVREFSYSGFLPLNKY